MSDVQIVLTDDLPGSLQYAVEFAPQMLHIAIRPGADLIPTVCDAIAAAFDCYRTEELLQLNPDPVTLLLASA